MRTRADIETEPRRISNDFNQRRRIAQSKVDALSGNRMNAMRCVADQGKAARNEIERNDDV
jgi:hypothetical protein